MDEPAELERREMLDLIGGHLRSARDEAMVVLKAHLVVESLLMRLLERHIENREPLQAARLSFWQLVHLVEAHRSDPAERWLWAALRALNSLRNELAHKLTSDLVERKWEQFIQATAPRIHVPASVTTEPRRRAIRLHILCAVLADKLYATSQPPAAQRHSPEPPLREDQQPY